MNIVSICIGNKYLSIFSLINVSIIHSCSEEIFFPPRFGKITTVRRPFAADAEKVETRFVRFF